MATRAETPPPLVCFVLFCLLASAAVTASMIVTGIVVGRIIRAPPIGHRAASGGGAGRARYHDGLDVLSAAATGLNPAAVDNPSAAKQRTTLRWSESESGDAKRHGRGEDCNFVFHGAKSNDCNLAIQPAMVTRLLPVLRLAKRDWQTQQEFSPLGIRPH